MTPTEHLNIRISAFGDLAECKQAIASIPDGITIHVCDGRYATFDGATDLTPGLEAFCDKRPDCVYHEPPEFRLPFGHEFIADGVPLEWRPGVHAKARWIDRVVPQDEWTLKLDTDERLTRFNVTLDDLDREKRYAPVINLHGDTKENVHVARLWVPKHWTRWIDDCLLPRELFPRSTPLERLQKIWREDEFRVIRFMRLQETRRIMIDNYGADRPADYQRRRVQHLNRIGRDDRWAELDDRLEKFGDA